MVMVKKFLKPGEFYVTNKPMILETLVGSCVSVCLYNPRNGCAAMNHFLRDRVQGEETAQIGEFASTSTEHIIAKLTAADPEPGHYRAMVFGGAAVVKTTGGESDIGKSNAEAALRILAKARIRVVRKEVGGTRGRRVKFDTRTGTVQTRFAGDIPRMSRRT
jgi:chemotaxis protein CheD